ncbi:MAG TPA: DUF488 domain-containing protein [Candidatus Aquilonibacter sp.]|nr:DUF488 domain-containing protein [Candidatus Aquilonibacter sp.]
MTLWTFGHGTASEDELASLIRDRALDVVIDVRKIPKSRTHPHVWSDRMAEWVPALSGAAYEWHPEFGGFRRANADSPNRSLRNEAFRAYADYMQTPEFLEPFAELLERAQSLRIAIMCSESVWWRCHRRLMSDAAELRGGVPVEHIMHAGRAVPHALTQGLRLRPDGILQYDL